MLPGSHIPGITSRDGRYWSPNVTQAKIRRVHYLQMHFLLPPAIIFPGSRVNLFMGKQHVVLIRDRNCQGQTQSVFSRLSLDLADTPSFGACHIIVSHFIYMYW